MLPFRKWSTYRRLIDSINNDPITTGTLRRKIRWSFSFMRSSCSKPLVRREHVQSAECRCRPVVTVMIDGQRSRIHVRVFPCLHCALPLGWSARRDPENPKWSSNWRSFSCAWNRRTEWKGVSNRRSLRTLSGQWPPRQRRKTYSPFGSNTADRVT